MLRHLRRLALPTGLALLTIGLAPRPAAAQAQSQSSRDASRWGISGSFAPNWRIPTFMADIITSGDEQVDIDGKEFSIGVVRGSIRGGDWGVSFVYRRFNEGSTSLEQYETCTGPTGSPPCFPAQTLERYDDSYFPGVEFHWFKPFVTIQDRVQIGINLAAGAARPSGTMVAIKDDVKIISLNPVTTVPVHTEETRTMSDDWGGVFPFLKAEAQAAVLVGSAFKIKAGGGLNFPGAGFRVVGVYLFGGD